MTNLFPARERTHLIFFDSRSDGLIRVQLRLFRWTGAVVHSHVRLYSQPAENARTKTDRHFSSFQILHDRRTKSNATHFPSVARPLLSTVSTREPLFRVEMGDSLDGCELALVTCANKSSTEMRRTKYGTYVLVLVGLGCFLTLSLIQVFRTTLDILDESYCE